MLSTHITIRDVSLSFENFLYRTPIKFGGVALDRVTLLNVKLTVEDRQGKTSQGFGSMPLGNVWAWPSRSLNYEQTLQAMQDFAVVTARAYSEYKTPGHPIDITHTLEPRLLSEQLRQQLSEAMPPLAKLVVISSFDAALHDAFGKRMSLNCYHTYGPEFLEHDLGHYLGNDFAGEQLQSYISKYPRPRLPLYHLVGALDPLTPEEVLQPIGDGLPEHLGDWILQNGLTHLKIKLNGDNLAWDVERVIGVDIVAGNTQGRRGVSQWWYSLDFNERCPNVDYLLDFLDQLKQRSPQGYERVHYVEQPTARDLKANPQNKLHEAAKRKPVVIDESLLDMESLHLARDLGYSGVAFKACKGQTQSLLLAAAAQKYNLFRCVQDLTCPGASLIQSAGLAAHIPGVAAIEANSRQYCPAANNSWEARFPELFSIQDGTMFTGQLTGVGLGAIEQK
jgi:L-alanine-DL-glutamate epimerase-like enolase superfamily enzyme